MAAYCILFMGSFSPIHCRAAAAGICLLCVVLSYTATTGLMFILGARVAGIHNLLPFLLIGIGVDDSFVITAAIDQTDTKLTAEERLAIGLKHAGPSITITSFTNAIAFWMGASTSLEALKSFCLFAGTGVMFLYASSLTLYTSFIYWDVQRQIK